MTEQRWKASNTCVYNISYHIIWCTKYRRKVLDNGIDDRLKKLIFEKWHKLWIDVCTMEVMPDHIHIFIKSKSTLAPHYIVQQLKWYTSRILRLEFAQLKSRLPTLWTRSYYIDSVWSVSEENIKRYIENQKNK